MKADKKEENKLEAVFKRLDQEEFRHRMQSSFPAVYLTIISIIQGVAMGILVYNTFEYIKDPKITGCYVRFLPYSAMCFIFLIVVTREYTWLVGTLKWSPKVLDTIIPFVLGLSEIIPVFYLTSPHIWWLLVAILCFVGSAAFSNTLWNCKKSMFGENEKAYSRTVSALKWDRLIALIATDISIFSWILLPKKVWYLEKVFLILLLVCVVAIMYKDEKFIKALHKDFNLSQ